MANIINYSQIHEGKYVLFLYRLQTLFKATAQRPHKYFFLASLPFPQHKMLVYTGFFPPHHHVAPEP